MPVELKTVAKTIGDIEFQTTQFPAMRALEVMVSLQRLATNVNPNMQLSQAAPTIMAGLDPAGARKMVLDLLQSTTALVKTAQGSRLITLDKQENIDLIFSGKLKVLFEVMAHAIEVNYGDFNDGSNDPAPLTQTLSQ